jgi:hypothetical protein
MKKYLVLSCMLGILALMSNAHAAANNNCNGQSCVDGGSTSAASGVGIGLGVGYGGSSNSAANASGGNATGGNALAIGGSNSVDVRNSSTNVNVNTVNNTSSNVQGQIQGQDQAQNQSTNNANNSTNSVVVQGDNFEARRIPVNTAFAPSIAPTANCALSVSGGVSVVGFSGSFGKAYIDDNCAALERVRNVALVLNDIETAEAMLCQDKKYAKARKAVGRECPAED